MSRRLFLQGATAVGATTLVGSALSDLLEGSTLRETMTTDFPTAVFHPLTPVPIERVTIDDPFWTPKRNTWRAVTLWDCIRKFEETEGGAIRNFDRVRDGLKGGHAGPPWFDGLIYETLRGGADFLRSNRDPGLEAKFDEWISSITAAAAKDPDGYINTYTQLEEPDHRWGLNGGLEVWQHEFYNLGALVDAGVHYYQATGKTALLDAGVKIANTIADLVGPAPKKNLVPSHELPEEAMLGLYQLLTEQPSLAKQLKVPTDAKRYLALAEFWIENRGKHSGKPEWTTDRGKAEAEIRHFTDFSHGRPSWGAYAQDDKPVLEQDEIVGHAVRATLLWSAVAAAARINRREDYAKAAFRVWENMTYRRMHITGGVGAYAQEEKFGPDYVLPNDAYLETCAAVGAAFFHQNMNWAFGHATFVDELERALFNGVLCGVSIAGDTYTYQNPIEADESFERWSWHSCPCCPPMFFKIMSALPGYVYATDADSLYVNLFLGSTANVKVNGCPVKVQQTTEYPWKETVRIQVDPQSPAKFGLMVRIPSWCAGASCRVNGDAVSVNNLVRGYLRLEREWKAGDVVELTLPMPVQAMVSHPKVAATQGKVALVRGPLIYCIESIDNDLAPASLVLNRKPKFKLERWPDRLGGVIAIHTSAGVEAESVWQKRLYSTHTPTSKTMKPIVAIPFYANRNRGAAQMAVWIRTE